MWSDFLVIRCLLLGTSNPLKVVEGLISAMKLLELRALADQNHRAKRSRQVTLAQRLEVKVSTEVVWAIKCT